MIFTQPSDVGFGCVSRRRAFTIFLRHDAGRFIGEPQEIYDALRKDLDKSQLTISNLIAGTTDTDAQDALDKLKAARGTADGLTQFEATNIKQYHELMDSLGYEQHNQVSAANQNPLRCCKKSGQGTLPAFTTNDKILWVRSRGGPLLAFEKFIAHGWPMTQELSNALGIPVT